jgi:LacI family transcriptional regulator
MSIKEIAKASGVSTATVSRVLNGSEKVREVTAKRVLEIAEQLNYRMDNVARRMKVKSSESLVIGLIITDIGNPFFSDIVKGVEDIAFRKKHILMICNTNESPDKELLFLNSMLSEKVSGVIIVPTSGNAQYFERLDQAELPIVMVDRCPKNLTIDTVSLNNVAGGYLATQLLIKNGHKRIGIVCGINGLSNTVGRYDGYVKALAEANIPVSENLITYGNYVESGGQEAMNKLLSLENPPTAVFSTNNLMTLGCIKEIYKRKLTIPSDVALIGFDDSTWAEVLMSPLTTIKQPGYEIGVNAAELLFKRFKNKKANKMNIVLNPELVIRESCGS